MGNYNTVYKRILEDKKVEPTPTDTDVVTVYNAVLGSNTSTGGKPTVLPLGETFNPSVGTNGAPKTYDQFVSEGGAGAESIAYQNWLNSYNAAEAERKRATNAATAMYDKSRQTYGAMAEQLRASGMQGAGYSDYLDSKAYATMGSQIASANVTSEAAKRQAEATAVGEYAKIDEQNRLEEKAKTDAQENAYLTDLENISTLTEDYINSLDAAVAAGKYNAEYAKDIKARWEANKQKVEADEKKTAHENLTSSIIAAANSKDGASLAEYATTFAAAKPEEVEEYINSDEFNRLTWSVGLDILNELFPKGTTLTQKAAQKMASERFGIKERSSSAIGASDIKPSGYAIPTGSVMDYAIAPVFARARDEGNKGPLMYTDKNGNVYYQKGVGTAIVMLDESAKKEIKKIKADQEKKAKQYSVGITKKLLGR